MRLNSKVRTFGCEGGGMMAGLGAVGRALKRRGFQGVELREWRQSVVLEGRVQSWPEYIEAGYAAANKGYKGVVNDLQVEGAALGEEYCPPIQDNSLAGQEFDLVIVGGGVIGCAIARELCRWSLTVAVLEKEDDLAKQTSSRNNGIIHPGIAAPVGSKKLLYNIRGNRMYTQAAQELGFKLERCGSIVLLEHGYYQPLLPFVRSRALKKGIDGVFPFRRQMVFEREPNVTPAQKGGVFLPSAGVVAPYEVTVAYGENAVENGAQVFLNTMVRGFRMEGNQIVEIMTNRGTLRAKVVINAAGVWADKVAGFADDRFFTIHGRKGTIAILDKKCRSHLVGILAMPKLGSKAHTKGGGLSPTVEGNLLIGPTAMEVFQREDWSTSAEDLDFLLSRHLALNTCLMSRDIITYFAGVRACTFEEDFIVEPSQHVTNLVHVAGIQSPGLASAPAIAQDGAAMAVELLKGVMDVKPNPTFNPRRRVNPHPESLSLEERARLIRANPAYGRIVCRCEEISEGEIVAAIKSPIPATSLDAVKRRVRAGMGRCQGGFCTPAVIEILARVTGESPLRIAKGRPGSELLFAETKVPKEAETGG